MSPEQAVISRLLATSAVTALVSTRVWLQKLPQHPALPAVRVQLITHPQEKHLRGPNGMTMARVQVDTYTADSGVAYTRAASIADAIDASLAGVTGAPFTVDDLYVAHVQRVDRRHLFEADELELFRILQDYRVWSRPMN